MHIDSSYRLLLANEVMVRDLLALPELAFLSATMDLDSLIQVPSDMVSNTGTQRRADLVWQARAMDGPHVRAHPHVYVHIEHQSSGDPRMALRMLTYRGLIYEGTLGKAGAQWLPALIPLVLYSGEEPWKVDTEVRDLVVPVGNQLEPFQPKLKYCLVDQKRLVERWTRDKAPGGEPEVRTDQRDGQAQCSEVALAVDSPDLSNNLAWLLFRLEHNQGVEDALELLRQVDRVTAQPRYEEVRKAFGCWVRTVLLRQVATANEDQESLAKAGFKEMIDMLAERSHGWHHKWMREGMEKGIEQGLQKGLEQGLEKGLEQGQEQGQRRMLRAMLVQKFGPVDEAVQNRIEQANRETIEQWALNVLNASHIEDVFRR